MYQKLYHTLFNAITDALGELERQNLGVARDILEKAQQDCEEDYLSAGEHGTET